MNKKKKKNASNHETIHMPLATVMNMTNEVCVGLYELQQFKTQWLCVIRKAVKTRWLWNTDLHRGTKLLCTRHNHLDHSPPLYQVQNWSVRNAHVRPETWQQNICCWHAHNHLTTTSLLSSELVSQNSVSVRLATWQQNIYCRHAHNRLNHHLFIKFRTGQSELCPCQTGNMTTEHLLQACPLPQASVLTSGGFMVSGEEAFSSLDNWQCTPVFG